MTPEVHSSLFQNDPLLDKWRRYSKHQKPFLKWHPNPRIDQTDFRGRDDDVGLNTNTWNGGGAQNANWDQDEDVNFRIRFLCQEVNADAKTLAVKAQFQVNGAGGYTDVAASGTAIIWGTSTQYADDDSATPALLTGGTGTFAAGYGSETDNIAPDSGSVSIAADGYTVFEFVFQINSAVASEGDNFQIRLVESDGTAFFGYTSEPTVTWPAPPANLIQNSFRWRNDDGTEVTATWRSAKNGDITIPTSELDTNLRLRFGMRNTGGTSESDQWQLQYSLNSGTWTDATDVSSVARSSASPNVTETDATTEQLLDPGTFVAGGIDETNGNESFTLGAGEDTEEEFVFQLRSADVSDTDTVDMRLRVVGGNSVTYTEVPRVTVSDGAAADEEVLHRPKLVQSLVLGHLVG